VKGDWPDAIYLALRHGAVSELTEVLERPRQVDLTFDDDDPQAGRLPVALQRCLGLPDGVVARDELDDARVREVVQQFLEKPGKTHLVPRCRHRHVDRGRCVCRTARRRLVDVLPDAGQNVLGDEWKFAVVDVGQTVENVGELERVHCQDLVDGAAIELLLDALATWVGKVIGRRKVLDDGCCGTGSHEMCSLSIGYWFRRGLPKRSKTKHTDF